MRSTRHCCLSRAVWTSYARCWLSNRVSVRLPEGCGGCDLIAGNVMAELASRGGRRRGRALGRGCGASRMSKWNEVVRPGDRFWMLLRRECKDLL